MSDLHIDDFYADAAKVLAQLYATFPRAHTVFVDDVCTAGEPDEFGLPSERHMACFATFVWLADEGFVRYVNTIRTDAIDQAVLTGRCFTRLNRSVPGVTQTPDLPASVASERSTHIHALREALKSRSSSQIRQIMVLLFDQMM